MSGVPGGSRVKILNGTKSDSVSQELIAETPMLSSGTSSYKLIAVEVNSNGRNYGTPQGRATITYNPSAQTITVTLTASGVTPGPHAAHIHIGSCQSQGGVQYMLQDFTADGDGNINHETRVVTGVTTPVAAGVSSQSNLDATCAQICYLTRVGPCLSDTRHTLGHIRTRGQADEDGRGK